MSVSEIGAVFAGLVLLFNTWATYQTHRLTGVIHLQTNSTLTDARNEIRALKSEIVTLKALVLSLKEKGH